MGEKGAARRLIAFLEEKRGTYGPFLILTHDYPDPDALASAYALQTLLRERYGIESRIVYGGIIGRRENRLMVRLLKLPIHKLRHGELKKYPAVALVDTQPGFKNNSFSTRRKATLVIDQHASDREPQAEKAIIDTDCGATCVILAQALLLTGVKIPVPVATALAYGILSDTLHLYRVRRQDVIQTYLDILPQCDMTLLARIQNPPRPADFFVTLARAVSQARVKRGLVVASLGEVESPDTVSQVADFLLTYQGTRVSFSMGRVRERLHCSLRVRDSTLQAVEVLRDSLEKRGEAGGHGSIAGGSFHVGHGKEAPAWEKAENSVLERVMKRLRISRKGDFKRPFALP